MINLKDDFSPEELRYNLFSGRANFENYQHLRDVFAANDILRPIPLSYSFEYTQHIEYQTKTLLELIRLQKQKKLKLHSSARYLSDFSAYTAPFEVHFGIFQYLSLYFAQEPKLVGELISNIDIFGGVLLHEMNFADNSVNDDIKTTAEFDAKTQEVVINSSKGTAKFCPYFNPYGSHVIVLCKLLNNGEHLGNYPFLVALRDKSTGELKKGIHIKWLGPSLGHRGGREHCVVLENLRVPLKQHLLNKHIQIESNSISLVQPDMILNFLIKVALMLQKLQDSHRAIRELSKAVFLVVKYTNMRTQFKTLPQKGQERKIFDYQFNKMRIIKNLVNTIVFQASLSLLSDKNGDKMSDYITFIDGVYPLIYERAAEGVESLREGTGGMGYLKFSGIPTPHENIINGSVAACRSKEEKYLDVALMVLNANLEQKSEFFQFVAPRLSEEGQTPNPSVKHDKDYLNLNTMIMLLSYKVTHRRTSLLKLKTEKKVSELTRELLKENKFAYQEAIQLGKDFCESTLVGLCYILLFKYINRDNNTTLAVILHSFVLQNFIDDIRPIIDDPTIVPEDFYSRIKDSLASNTDKLGEIAERITQAYEFDGDMLNSCFQNTADDTYEKLLDLSKNHNLRNDPKVHAEITKDLIEYLNRPREKL